MLSANQITKSFEGQYDHEKLVVLFGFLTMRRVNEIVIDYCRWMWSGVTSHV